MKQASNLELRYGIYLFLGLGAFFLLMDALGLESNSYLRIMNVFIVFAVLRSYINRKLNEGSISYPKLFINTITTTMIGVVFSVVGFSLFLSVFKTPEYLTSIRTSFLLGAGESNLFQFSFALAIEGISSSVVLSYIMLQYYKKYTMAQ